jgi:hypothetical protein
MVAEMAPGGKARRRETTTSQTCFLQGMGLSRGNGFQQQPQKIASDTTAIATGW